jgi:hypothetical protein
MNGGEFNTWLARHQTLFPKLSQWLEEQDGRSVILAAWSKALSTCTAMHASDATDRMLRGVPPTVEFNDWASLPSVVIQHCRLMGSAKPERTGDSNFVSGAALKALRKAFTEVAPDENPQVVRDFEALIGMMGKHDYLSTKKRILDSMDAGKLSPKTASDLLVSAGTKAEVHPFVWKGNVGDAWEGGAR